MQYPYNYFAMEEIEFMNEEFQFLESFKNSENYQEMKKLSEKIYQDDRLVSLSEERDSYIAMAEKETDEKKKHDYLVLSNQKDEELRRNPLMAEYLDRYQKLRHILVMISDRLTKEIKKYD